MPVINRVADMAEEVAAWRRDLHENPEIEYELARTAGIVADKLKAFGCDEVVPGIGKIGVVGVIRGRKQGSGKVIGLRADMDALPINEMTSVPHKSKKPGMMHACGHDGHTSMLLGAARYLAETRNFDGTAIMIFQPAEEGGAGGKAMCDDGMMERWGVQEVYGMHNMPGIPIGAFATRPGPLMAAADKFTILIDGKGGHGAMPHKCIDLIVVGSQIVMALQSIVSRNADPLDSAVVSTTFFRAGDTFNVIPQTLELRGTVRTLTPGMRDLCESRIRTIVEATCAMHGATAKIDYHRGYPVTVNHERQTEFAAAIARSVVGDGNVDINTPPLMGAEDFSYMLEARPGAYVFIGNGDTASVHHPAYDFNDAAIPYGVSFFAKVVETGMPA